VLVHLVERDIQSKACVLFIFSNQEYSELLACSRAEHMQDQFRRALRIPAGRDLCLCEDYNFTVQ
jgi:hypothetical protein